MIFTLVTNKENPEINPLIKSVSSIVPLTLGDELYIYDSFVYAIECGEDASYLNDEIRKNVWWTESLDDTIGFILKRILNNFIIKPIFSDIFLENCFHIEYRTDSVVVLISDTVQRIIKVFDKRIGGYFSGDINCKKTLTYENKFRKLLKCCGLVEKEYTLSSITFYLKKIIGEGYELYVSVIFYTALPFLIKEENSCSQSGWDVWNNLVLAEDYFNKVKIYNLEQSTIHDFDFKKDENGGYYVQYEYNASESITGRMFTSNLKGYQPLQTLQKGHRGLLKAEKNCTFIEYDFKSFELSIIKEYYCFQFNSKPSIVLNDPHEEICSLLGIDPIENRAFGKRINYAIVYGMSLNHLVDMVSEKIFLDKYFIVKIVESYSYYQWSIRLEEYLKVSICEKILNKKFLRNPFGRLIKIEKEYAMLNNFIQSTACDILYKKIIGIIEIFKESKISEKNKILFQNHDSILIQLENSVIIKTNVIEQINELMQSSVLFFNPKVIMKSGTNWGALK